MVARRRGESDVEYTERGKRYYFENRERILAQKAEYRKTPRGILNGMRNDLKIPRGKREQLEILAELEIIDQEIFAIEGTIYGS